MIKSVTTVCYEVFHEVRRAANSLGRSKKIMVNVHPQVADTLLDEVPNEFVGDAGPDYINCSSAFFVVEQSMVVSVQNVLKEFVNIILVHDVL